MKNIRLRLAELSIGLLGLYMVIVVFPSAAKQSKDLQRAKSITDRVDSIEKTAVLTRQDGNVVIQEVPSDGSVHVLESVSNRRDGTQSSAQILIQVLPKFEPMTPPIYPSDSPKDPTHE